jgi:hypothetical protein
MPPQVDGMDFAAQQKCSVAKSATETLLRVLGGTHIYVRVPLAFAEAGDDAQLGKAGAASEDVELAPVVVLARANRQKELLIPASSLAEIGSPREFFESAIGVVLAKQLMRVVSVEHEEVGGEAFLYRVLVSA